MHSKGKVLLGKVRNEQVGILTKLGNQTHHIKKNQV